MLCHYFEQKHCLSCEWIRDPYAEQLQKKERILREKLAFLPGFTVLPSQPSSESSFRNRIKMSVTGTLESPVIGLLGEVNLDEGRELLDCPIQHVRLNELLAAIPDLIRRYQLIPYRIQEKKGELKGLIAFHSSTEMYLRFVLRSKECVARIKKLLPELQRQFPDLVCVSANIQPIPHAILEGEEEIIFTERTSIDYPIGPFTLKLAPQAFVQTNREVAAKLYQTAAEWIRTASPKKMMELYCGQGAFSFFAAKLSPEIEKVLGVEINEDAVRTANETVQRLGLPRLHFICSDATQVAAEVKDFAPELILVNPPRAGLKSGVKMLVHQGAPYVVYSSCSLDSLSKDLEELSTAYSLKKVQIFDLFPHTEHFEVLAFLEKM